MTCGARKSPHSMKILLHFRICEDHKMLAPGQGIMVHGLRCVSSPGQAAPPCAGGGSSQRRVRVSVPSAHVTEHPLHGDQPPHTPSTAEKICLHVSQRKKRSRYVKQNANKFEHLKPVHHAYVCHHVDLTNSLFFKQPPKKPK